MLENNLIVGERYYVKHGTGNWEGYVTFDGWHNDLMKVIDIDVVKCEDEQRQYYKEKGCKSMLGGTPEWWGFEPVILSLENE